MRCNSDQPLWNREERRGERCKKDCKSLTGASSEGSYVAEKEWLQGTFSEREIIFFMRKRNLIGYI